MKKHGLLHGCFKKNSCKGLWLEEIAQHPTFIHHLKIEWFVPKTRCFSMWINYLDTEFRPLRAGKMHLCRYKFLRILFYPPWKKASLRSFNEPFTIRRGVPERSNSTNFFLSSVKWKHNSHFLVFTPMLSSLRQVNVKRLPSYMSDSLRFHPLITFKISMSYTNDFTGT